MCCMKKNIVPIVSGFVTAWIVGSVVAVYSIQDYSNSLMVMLFGVGIGFGTLIGLIPGFTVGYLVYTVQAARNARTAREEALKAELEIVKKPTVRKTTAGKPAASKTSK